MLIEGIYLYLMVITVFDNNNEQLRLYGVCAYGKIADQYVSVLKLIAQYVYLWFMAQLTKYTYFADFLVQVYLVLLFLFLQVLRTKVMAQIRGND